MKKILAYILCVISLLNLKAQKADLATHNNDAVIELFNKQLFKETYGLLNSDFKAQTSESEWITFLKNNVYEPLGVVEKTIHLMGENEGEMYKWVFKNAVLQLSLSVNKQKKITGFSLEPYKEMENTQVSQSNNPMQTALDKIVDSVARTYIDKGSKAGLSVGVIKDGKTHIYHYGMADKDKKELPLDNTLYEIGSITKTFTGMLLAQALLEKKVNLDDDIRQYLTDSYPNLEFKGSPILIKHLANHTSGLPGMPADIYAQKGYDINNPYKHYTSEMALAYLHKIKLDTLAGIKSAYSNYGTGLMGIILERIYKMPYQELLTKYITIPLSMNNTKIEIAPSDSIRFAKPYKEQGKKGFYWDLTGLGAAGAIRSTVVDMLKYAHAVFEAKDAATQLVQKPIFKDKSNTEIALFWHLTTTKQGDTRVWHNGGTGGFSSFCGFSRSKNLIVVMLSNCSSNVTTTAMNLMKNAQ
jgi:CubicO group peptidase (beta-lactamase class C family)